MDRSILRGSDGRPRSHPQDEAWSHDASPCFPFHFARPIMIGASLIRPRRAPIVTTMPRRSVHDFIEFKSAVLRLDHRNASTRPPTMQRNLDESHPSDDTTWCKVSRWSLHLNVVLTYVLWLMIVWTTSPSYWCNWIDACVSNIRGAATCLAKGKTLQDHSLARRKCEETCV